MILLLVACAADLLPGERVIGEEIAAVVLQGSPSSEFGAAIALSQDAVLVTAPGDAEVSAWALDGAALWVTGEPGDTWRDVWWVGGEAYAGGSRDGVRGVYRLRPEVELVAGTSGAAAAAPCPDGSWLVAPGGADAVACSEQGMLRVLCTDGGCEVSHDGEPIGEATAGSAVAWVDGVACWGDAQRTVPAAAGSLECTDGAAASGLEGDHLGVSIASRRVSGVFNKWLVPARARILSLDGDEIWSVDRAAEETPLALANLGAQWAVGVMGYGGQQAREGRVYLFEAPE